MIEEGQVADTWLEVTVLGGNNLPGGIDHTSTTGLTANDVFYFGNAPGEVTSALGAGRALGTGLPTPPLVNAADVIAIRDNPCGELNPASIDNPFDINRDARVDAVDLILARNHATSPLSTLKMILPADD